MNIPEISTLIHLLAVLPFNIFDYILFICFAFYVYEETISGARQSLSNLVSLVISFFGGLFLYQSISTLLTNVFSISKGISDAMSFLFVVIALYLLLLQLSLFIFRKYTPTFSKKVSKTVAFFSGSVSFFFISAFVVSVLLSFYISPYIKSSIRDSLSGRILFTKTQAIEVSTRQVFGETINETLNFLTLDKDTNSTVPLHFSTTSVSVDMVSEEKMFNLINRARTQAGLDTLSAHAPLIKLARSYGAEMFKRGYFSHYTPEGLSPFDRLSQYSITYNSAAENLAYAPDVNLAFSGLMKSTEHRKNILDPSFHKIGIGVIDAGIYGKMFVQEFTN